MKKGYGKEEGSEERGSKEGREKRRKEVNLSIEFFY